MAKRLISSTGSNTAPYDTWAKAATSLAASLVGYSAGDQHVIDVDNPPADITANTTWTFTADCSVVTGTQSGVDGFVYQPMGESAWLGNATDSYSLTLAGGYKVGIAGLTLRISGASNVLLSIANIGGHYEWEDCLFWQGTTQGSARIAIGSGSSNVRSYNKLKNCSMRFGAAQSIQLGGAVEIEGGGISAAGSAAGILFQTGNSQNADYLITGFDMTNVTGPLVANHTSCAVTYRFAQCKIPVGVTVLDTQSVANKSAAKAWLMDCSSGDTHGLFGYYDALGSVVTDAAVYYPGGPAALTRSWRITTTAACTFQTPFVTPWISAIADTPGAITPRFQVARDGSATALQNNQAWAEFMAKVTSGSTQSTLARDRMAIDGAPADQAAGAGTGAWTGLSGTAWSGLLDSGAPLTIAEAGNVLGRVAVAAPSISLNVNPEILTA